MESSVRNDLMEMSSAPTGSVVLPSPEVVLGMGDEDGEQSDWISMMEFKSEGLQTADLEIQEHEQMEVEDDSMPVLKPEGRLEGSELVSLENNFLLPESSLLFNQSAGFSPEENLKRPFAGFTEKIQAEYYSQLEVHSSNLFAKVQRLKEGLKNSLISLVKSKKGMIPIRKKFPKVTLFYKRLIPAPPPLQLGGSKSLSIHSKLLFADESIYSKEKLNQLKAPFEAGWKREIVLRSEGCKGRTSGNVYYYSPSGVKFKSSKEVESYLKKSSGESLTVENFTFSMVRLSFDPTKEVVREAFTGTSPALDFPIHLYKEKFVSEQSVLAPKKDAVEVKEKSEEAEDRKRRPMSNQLEMGMLPPKYPKYMEITLNRGRPSQEMRYGFNKEEELQEDGASKSLMEIVNDSLFQISAINQSRDRIELESYQRLLEQNQNQEAVKGEEVVVTDAPIPAEDSPKVEEQLETPLKEEGKELVVAPPTLNRKTSLCSIFCEGRGGRLPTLQCVKCLCLLHAECVGLPDLVCCSNFMCPNCHDAILHRNREKVEMPIQTPSKTTSVPTVLPKKSVPSPPLLKPLTKRNKLKKKPRIPKLLPLNILCPPKPTWNIKSPPTLGFGGVPRRLAKNSPKRKMPVVPIPKLKSYLKPKNSVKVALRLPLEARNLDQVTISLVRSTPPSSTAESSSPFKIPVGRPPLAAKKARNLQTPSVRYCQVAEIPPGRKNSQVSLVGKGLTS